MFFIKVNIRSSTKVQSHINATQVFAVIVCYTAKKKKKNLRRSRALQHFTLHKHTFKITFNEERLYLTCAIPNASDCRVVV